MTIINVLTIGDEDHTTILRAESKDINTADITNEETAAIVKDMIDSSKAAGGSGLAAPQIGYNVRIFITGGPEPLVIINPNITAKIGKIKSYGEGCLSVPGQRFDVKRAKQVVLTGFNTKGESIRYRSKSATQAIIIQHEVDHLDGILICDMGIKPNV